LSPDAILRSEPQYYGSYAIFDYRTVSTEFLTKEEHAVLEYISNRSSEVDEITKETGVEYNRCNRFLKRMLRLGYVQKDIQILKPRVPQRPEVSPTLYEQFPLPFLSAPTSVDLFITNQCNLRCVHCFSDSKEVDQTELPIEEIRSIIDQLERLGVLELRINGGEPLLHSRIHEILSFLKEKRIRKVILTNGTVLDSEMIRLLEEAQITPTVSLDGSETNDHDSFRGVKGSFDRTIEALDSLRKSKIEYGVNCCLHRRNLSKYREIIDLAVKHNASRIAFLDLKPNGRMRDNMMWAPTYEDYVEAFLGLVVARMRYRGKIDIALDTFLRCEPLRESIHEVKTGYVSCHAGKTRLSIASDGLVYPCNLVISDPKWNMGNIRDKTIQGIWFSDRWRFFRGTRIQELTKCRNCKELKKCKDFHCRLLPYVINNDPFGPHLKCASR